jgi:hypothetical protein
MRININTAITIPTNEKLYQYGLNTHKDVGIIQPEKKNEK